MKFTVLGGGDEIGANSYLIDMEGAAVMLDAGFHPRRIGYEGLPDFDRIGQLPLCAVILSHCHLDHLGALPVALRRNPHALVYMTRPSHELAPEMLHSTVRVMERQHSELGVREYPLYTHEDVEMVSYCFHGMSCDREFQIQSQVPNASDIRVRFFDAGHILGAAGILLSGDSESVFYTGDTSRSDQEVLKGAVYPDGPIDTLILESTLAANPETVGVRRHDEVRRLARGITQVIVRGGSVLIPAFALGRTQEILVTLDRLRSQGRIPEVEIFTAGLGCSVSRVYDRTAGCSRRRDPSLVIDRLDIRQLPRGDPTEGVHLKRPSVIVVSSGMMERGTLSHRIACEMLPDARHAIFFVGYVDPDAPGHCILTSQPGDRVPFGFDEALIDVACEVERFHFSAHADRLQLLRLVEELTPSRVVLVHGEPESIRWMTCAIREKYPWIDVLAPEKGLTYELPRSTDG